MKTPKFKLQIFKFATGIIFGIAVAIVVFPLIGADNIYNQLEKFQYIFGLTIKDYFEDVDTEKMNEGAIRGMLKELDPHSAYIPAKDMKGVQQEMSGSFEGIGISFQIINDTLVVETVIPDGPCENVGIQERDRIVAVDGNSIIGLDRDTMPTILRGPKGTKVKLEIYRPGVEKPIDFIVTRNKIPLYSLESSFVISGTDIGYIKINKYAQTTSKELIEAGRKLKEAGMKRLVLDLRGNPGGLLDQAYSVADEFLKGDTIVYTHGKRSAEDQVFVARPGQTLEDIPLICLIDGNSASASEITAGAIQDLDRGLVVGVTSYGKGLVQRQYPIYQDGSAVRLTIAHFYSASGRCIQRPYKDKANWRRLTDRLELEEGANLEHTLDKIKKEELEKSKKEGNKSKNKKDNVDKNSIDMDSIEVFYTRAGRTVLGGGGITPDYVIKPDTSKMAALTVALWNKSVLLDFYDKYVDETKSKYGSDYNKFGKEFKFTDKMVKELKSLAESRDIVWDQEQFATDKDYITNRIKYLLARAVWDFNVGVELTMDSDRQLSKALELFPLAEKIQKLKRK